MTETQKQLAEENHNLIYWFLNKYHLPVEEYYGLAAIGLCKAASTFEGEKASFSTYASKCMFTAVFSEIRNEKTGKRIDFSKILSYDAEIKTDEEGGTFIDMMTSCETTEDIVLAKQMLEDYYTQADERDKCVIKLLLNGYKQREIALLFGFSQARISRIKKKFEQFINKYEGEK